MESCFAWAPRCSLSWPKSWSLQLLSNSSLWQRLHSPNPSLVFCMCCSPCVLQAKGRDLHFSAWFFSEKPLLSSTAKVRNAWVLLCDTQHMQSGENYKEERWDCQSKSRQKLVKKGQNQITRFFLSVALQAWEKPYFLIQRSEMSSGRNFHYSSPSPTISWTPWAFTLTEDASVIMPRVPLLSQKPTLIGIDATLKPGWNFTNYTWRKFQRNAQYIE